MSDWSRRCRTCGDPIPLGVTECVECTLAAPSSVREGGDGAAAMLEALLSGQQVPTHDDEGREIGLELRIGLLVSDLARLRTFVQGIADSGHSLNESAFLLLRGLATDRQEATDAV